MFRNYDDVKVEVRETYRRNHETQCVKFVRSKLDHYFGPYSDTRGYLTLWEIMEKLEKVRDESDPDTDLPQSQHAFQTAERLRKEHPDKDWLHLIGLIHDFGKLLICFGEKQEHCVGDTFPVGCAFRPEIIFHNLFSENPDYQKFGELGMYKKGCGFDKILMSFGHDEYFARILENHSKCTLPEEAIYVIRYHSFYAWHQAEAYSYLACNKDKERRSLLRTFQKCDLYSKGEKPADPASLKSYYHSLMVKYGLDGKIAI
jgi:inositol oxygenase